MGIGFEVKTIHFTTRKPHLPPLPPTLSGALPPTWSGGWAHKSHEESLTDAHTLILRKLSMFRDFKSPRCRYVKLLLTSSEALATFLTSRRFLSNCNTSVMCSSKQSRLNLISSVIVASDSTPADPYLHYLAVRCTVLDAHLRRGTPLGSLCNY